MSDETKTMRLKLHEIDRDTTTQIREEIVGDAVDGYVEAMGRGEKFPPLVVYYDQEKTRYWLADGWHRLSACETLGKESVECKIHQGDQAAAVRYAAQANMRHGLPMTTADKRKAVAAMLRIEPEWSDRAIAKHVGVSHTFVASCRSDQVESVATCGGPSLAEQHAKQKRRGLDGKLYNTSRPTDDPVLDYSEYDGDPDAELVAAVAEPFREALQLESKLRAILKEINADLEMGVFFRDKWTRVSHDLAATRATISACEFVERCDCEGGCARCRTRATSRAASCKRRAREPLS